MLTQIKAILKLARIHFLLGSGIFYLVGALMARYESGRMDWRALSSGMATMWLLQLSAHFLNEYYDRDGDQFNRHRTLFSGGSGVIAEGRLAPTVGLWAAAGTLILAVVLLVFLTRVLPTFGVTTAGLFTLAAIGAVGYSAPPLAFVERGLGEMDVTLIVGLFVPLFGYSAQTGRASPTFALACLPVATLILASVISVAFPDFEADRTTSKRTLVVILGPERAARLYSGLLAVGYVASWLKLTLEVPFVVLIAEAATLPVAALSLIEIRRGGYKLPVRYARNTFLGVGVVGAIGLAQVTGLLLVGIGD